jgi:hypothetical protein
MFYDDWLNKSIHPLAQLNFGMSLFNIIVREGKNMFPAKSLRHMQHQHPK